MLDYQGFTIDPLFRIYKDGKQIFTAWHQRCCSLEEAKGLIDLSNQARVEQVRRLPLLSVPLMQLLDEDEAREREVQREGERVNEYWERELNPE